MLQPKILKIPTGVPWKDLGFYLKEDLDFIVIPGRCITSGSAWYSQIHTDYWHQDCSGRPLSLFVWANYVSTMIRIIATGQVIIPPPEHLIWINNQQCEHRSPQYSSNIKRAFFRIIVP